VRASVRTPYRTRHNTKRTGLHNATNTGILHRSDQNGTAHGSGRLDSNMGAWGGTTKGLNKGPTSIAHRASTSGGGRWLQQNACALPLYGYAWWPCMRFRLCGCGPGWLRGSYPTRVDMVTRNRAQHDHRVCAAARWDALCSCWRLQNPLVNTACDSIRKGHEVTTLRNRAAELAHKESHHPAGARGSLRPTESGARQARSVEAC